MRRFRFITPGFLKPTPPRQGSSRGFVLSCNRQMRERVFKIYDEPESQNMGRVEDI